MLFRLPSLLICPGLVCAVGLLLAGCGQRAQLNFSSGELSFSLNASDFALPTELRSDDSPAQIRELECLPDGSCPGTTDTPISCEASLCNPAPVTVTVGIGDAVDVEALTDGLPKGFPEADMYAIREMRYSAPLNTLSVDLGEVRILWAPEGAPSGMTLLATVPPLPARMSANGTADIDPAGEAALSDFLTGVSPRVRFFAETDIDLEPGQAFPEGDLAISSEIALTASGPVLN